MRHGAASLAQRLDHFDGRAGVDLKPALRAVKCGNIAEFLSLLRAKFVASRSFRLFFQRRQHLDRRAAVDLEPGPLLEIGDRGLALGSDMPVRVAADVIAAPLEQRLQFLRSLARLSGARWGPTTTGSEPADAAKTGEQERPG
jgi:hypothetical protein